MIVPALQIEHLTKTFRLRREKGLIKGLFRPEYEEVHAVEDISFTVRPGEAVAFLGPNGAGKTTTMKVLTGLIHPTVGEARVLGHEPFAREHGFLRRIALVMGNKAGLNWDLTARQSFELFQHIYRIPKTECAARIAELAALLDVDRLLDRQVRRLSLGERMKLELIGAVLHSPEVLFLDEPTIGLDLIAKRNLRAFLREWQRRTGFTMILTSHDMADVQEICERVIVINHGRIVHDGPLAALVRQYRTSRYVRLTFAEDAAAPAVPGYAEPVEDLGGGRVYRVPEGQFVPFLGIATQLPGLLDLHIESVPLEQIISDLFTGKA